MIVAVQFVFWFGTIVDGEQTNVVTAVRRFDPTVVVPLLVL